MINELEDQRFKKNVKELEKQITERAYIEAWFRRAAKEQMRIEIKGFSFILAKTIDRQNINISILPYKKDTQIPHAMWREIFQFMESFGYKVDGIIQNRIVEHAKAFESPRRKILKALKNLGDKNLDVNV